METLPVFELERTWRGRVRAFARAQLPLLLGTTFVTVEGLWALPEVAGSSPAVFGTCLVVVASIAFVALPWERWPVTALLPLAVTDLIAVAFIRLAYFDHVPSVGILIVFPVVWLAYSFQRWAITVAVGGSFVVTLLPVVVHDLSPSTPLEIASVITLPVLISGLAIAVGEAARQLAMSQHRARETNIDLQASLLRANDSDHLARSIFESVNVALAFYDTERQLVMANTLAEQAVAAAGFRLTEEPYAGPQVRRADNTTPIDLDEQIIPRALRGDLHNHEMEWIGPPGHQRAIIATAQQVHHSDGELWGTLIAAHDVTDLARSLQVKEEFIATVSHELRTPLTTIIGYVEVLEDELIDQPQFIHTTLATVSRSALKLQQRVKELLDTADRRRHLDLEPADLTVTARRVASTFQTQAETAHIRLHVQTSEPTWVTVDPAKIEQVVENLLSNAIKYTAAGGTVTIAVASDENHAQLTVTDTGIGMSADELDLAFTSFWRAESARDQAIQGIGIGLGLVRDIIEAHHGTITLTSTPDHGQPDHGQPVHGTTATVRLPRRH